MGRNPGDRGGRVGGADDGMQGAESGPRVTRAAAVSAVRRGSAGAAAGSGRGGRGAAGVVMPKMATSAGVDSVLEEFLRSKPKRVFVWDQEKVVPRQLTRAGGSGNCCRGTRSRPSR